MKNVKTILTLLVFAMTMFSCQTNDELVELETLSETNQKSSRVSQNNPSMDSIDIFVTYPNSFYREELRNYYSSYFELIDYEECSSDSKTERWTIDYMTEEELNNIISEIVMLEPIEGTISSGPSEDDDPIGNISRSIIIRYRFSCD